MWVTRVATRGYEIVLIIYTRNDTATILFNNKIVNLKFNHLFLSYILNCFSEHYVTRPRAGSPVVIYKTDIKSTCNCFYVTRVLLQKLQAEKYIAEGS